MLKDLINERMRYRCAKRVLNKCEITIYMYLQMKKLENVNEAYVLPDTNSLYRELLLVKIKATQEERSALHEMTEIYRGKVVGLNKESMIIELTGSPKKIDGFMGMLEEYDIIEVSRTGVTGMARDSSEEKHLTGI